MQTERPRRIFLVGFMGSGKTTVGKLLAQKLGYRFFDLDSEIENERGLNASGIFDEEGESGFRDRETAALKMVGSELDIVMATGGGALMRPENQEFIRAHGVSVWLDAPLEVMLERCIGGPDRPLLASPEKMTVLLGLRAEAYRSAAITIKTADLTPEETVREILSGIGPQE